MGRRSVSGGDEEFSHVWVLVHLEHGTYVVETNSESGYSDIVGTVKEAAESTHLKIEKK